MDKSTGFHIIMGFRSKSISLLQKSFTGLIWPTSELCPLYSTSTDFLSVLSLILAFLSHNSLHLLCDSPIYPHKQDSAAATESKLLLPQRLFFATLFSPWFLSPSTIHHLLWYLCWCPDCKRLLRQRKLRHLTSTFLTLLNIITFIPIPDGMSYPIYPWSDGGYYVRNDLQNKMYHPGLILGLEKKTQTKNQTPKPTKKSKKAWS